MFRKTVSIFFALLISSCDYQGFCRTIISPTKCGAIRGSVFGSQHYKYKCKKVGDCCEVGKDCKEEDKKAKNDL